MHYDHVGGLTAGGSIVFPNAIVRADKHESDYWLSNDKMKKAPDDQRLMFENAMTSLAPYIAAGRYKPFDGATELTPGIRTHPSAGHTPGHTSYVVESKGEKLVLIGDLAHFHYLDFDHPRMIGTYDTDGQMAVAARLKDFSDAAKQGYLVGAAHLPFPGIGHVMATATGFQWQPINYSEMH
jgi:glyoxylase-like metal-dependent hydrolase (beta-lactamase superfamily II)